MFASSMQELKQGPQPGPQLVLALGRLVDPQVIWRVLSGSAFRLFAGLGLLLGTIMTAILVASLGLSLSMLAAIVGTGILTFLCMAFGTKLITGVERYTHYHYLISFLITTGFLLRLCEKPELPYLDIGILGFGLVTACGRVGCLMVGCCHGRPSAWGIIYPAQSGPEANHCLTGVRVFPLQAVEGLWLVVVVLLGVASLLKDRAPGTTLSWYLMAYACGRFHFEFMRGDAERRFALGFSEAQWTSLAIVYAVIGVECAGLLVFQLWQLIAALVISLIMILVALRRWWPQRQARTGQPLALTDYGRCLSAKATPPGLTTTG